MAFLCHLNWKVFIQCCQRLTMTFEATLIQITTVLWSTSTITGSLVSCLGNMIYKLAWIAEANLNQNYYQQKTILFAW